MTIAGDGYYAGTRSEMASFIPAGCGRVLEIGCGEANFLASISADEKWGVEPNSAAAKIASRHDVRILNGTFAAARSKLPLNYFDVVVCNDVIEHMEDHDLFLTQIKDHVAAEGCLVGSIPNVRYHKNLFDVLILKDWHYKDSGILDKTHFRFFTERSLRRTFIENGYRIEELRGINGTISLGWSKHQLAYSLLACSAILLTFGYFRDIRHMQFGFRVSPA